MSRVKTEVIKVAIEANTVNNSRVDSCFQYLYQLRVGLVVVDILTTHRSNLSLYSFQEYRKQQSVHEMMKRDLQHAVPSSSRHCRSNGLSLQRRSRVR